MRLVECMPRLPSSVATRPGPDTLGVPSDPPRTAPGTGLGSPPRPGPRCGVATHDGSRGIHSTAPDEPPARLRETDGHPAHGVRRAQVYSRARAYSGPGAPFPVTLSTRHTGEVRAAGIAAEALAGRERPPSMA